MPARQLPASRKLKDLRSLSWLTAAQLDKLALAMSVRAIEKRGIIFDHNGVPDASAYILLAGVAGISCLNRKGQRALMMMVGPGMILVCRSPSMASATISAAEPSPIARSERLEWML